MRIKGIHTYDREALSYDITQNKLGKSYLQKSVT